MTTLVDDGLTYGDKRPVYDVAWLEGLALSYGEYHRHKETNGWVSLGILLAYDMALLSLLKDAHQLLPWQFVLSFNLVLHLWFAVFIDRQLFLNGKSDARRRRRIPCCPSMRAV